MLSTLSSMATTLTVAAIALGAAAAAQEGAEAKSPEQLAWEKRVGKRFLHPRFNGAFDYIKEDPALPRVLLIGDSISIGYTPYVRNALAGKANVLRIPQNGGDTARGLEALDNWLGDGTWDVIHFNFGLHDLKHMANGKLDNNAPRVRSPEDYGKNLERIVQRLKAAGAALIWGATTPVPEGSGGRVAGDAARFNVTALPIMTAHGVAVNDLFTCVKPELSRWQRPANVHFLPEGSERLGLQTADAIRTALEQRPE